jgi:hypothetical protein
MKRPLPKARRLATTVALLALSGTALADSGAHYYMPHASRHARSGLSSGPHHPGASHHASRPHVPAGASQEPHGKPGHGAKAKPGAKRPTKHKGRAP